MRLSDGWFDLEVVELKINQRRVRERVLMKEAHVMPEVDHNCFTK